MTMGFLELFSKLDCTADNSNLLKQLSAVTQKSITRNSSSARSVLYSCEQFCRATSAAHQYTSLRVVLEFIHKATAEDAWLSHAATIVLPALHIIYVQLLTQPNSANHTSPSRVTLTLSEHVRGDADALRALCTIYTLVSDFCDVISEDVGRMLSVFITSAGAVLFGSDLQHNSVSVNASEYAMEELMRYSSFSMCNVLLSFPSLRGAASAVLGKRVSAFLDLLYASPELSVQRSLIMILRALYEHLSESGESQRNLKSRIENGLSAGRFGNGAALDLFKSLNLKVDDASDLSDAVVAKLLEGVDADMKCFTTDNCTVRMKGKVNGNSKKGGMQKASVDWNKNSVVVRSRHSVAAFFPMYTIVRARWLSAHKQVELTFHNAPSTNTEVSVRFAAGKNRNLLGRAIEQRIQQVLSRAASRADTFDEEAEFEPGRKSSRSNQYFGDSYETGVQRDQSPCSKSLESQPDADSQAREDELDNDGVGDENEDMTVSPLQSLNPMQKEDTPELQAAEETVFDNVGADGILLCGVKNSQITSARKEKADCPSTERVDDLATAARVAATPKSNLQEQHFRDRDDTTCYPHGVGTAEAREVFVDVCSGTGDEVVTKERSASRSIQNLSERRFNAEGSPTVTLDPSWPGSSASNSLGTLQNSEKTADNSPKMLGQRAPNGDEGEVRLGRSADVQIRADEQLGNDTIMNYTKKEINHIRSNSNVSGAATDSGSLLDEDEKIRQKLCMITRAILKVNKTKNQDRLAALRQDIKQNRSQTIADNQQLRINFRERAMATIRAEVVRITDYATSALQQIKEARSKLEMVRAGLVKYKGGLAALKASNAQLREHAQARISRIVEGLEKELDGCVKKNKRKSKERKKTDQLFLGLCQLLKDGNADE